MTVGLCVGAFISVLELSFCVGAGLQPFRWSGATARLLFCVGAGLYPAPFCIGLRLHPKGVNAIRSILPVMERSCTLRNAKEQSATLSNPNSLTQGARYNRAPTPSR